MSKEENKPLYKKTWFIVVSIIVVLAIIGGLSGEDTNESGVPDDTDLKDSNTPQQENSEISEYQKVLESYKELTEQKSEITSKYLDNDGYYSYYDLTLDELNNVKQIEISIKEQLSTYKNSISQKDENYEYIAESLNSSEKSLIQINEVLETVRNVSHIEAYATLDSWDADTDIDGVNVKLRIFSTPYEYVRAKGLLKVSIYHAVGFMDDQKGKLIESFTKELDINDFTTGTCGNEERYCGFIREIRFEFTEPNNLGGLNFGYMEVTFETQGKSFEAVDETFNEY